MPLDYQGKQRMQHNRAHSRAQVKHLIFCSPLFRLKIPWQFFHIAIKTGINFIQTIGNAGKGDLFHSIQGIER
ncbi:hypothetical protein ES705_30872 [subsurface metagenome]